MKNLVAWGVLAAAAGAWSLANLGPAPLPELSNMTATAILGWYAWHTASRTIPDLIENFRDELAAERQQRRQDSKAVVAALGRLTERMTKD